jgi:hypothetical protein
MANCRCLLPNNNTKEEDDDSWQLSLSFSFSQIEKNRGKPSAIIPSAIVFCV